MRTKVEKNHKKAAEEKLNINLPSPKVVLNANDCARLLDGMGKTSVLLVEKEGKMVAATSTSSSSTQSSAKSTQSSVKPSHSSTKATSSHTKTTLSSTRSPVPSTSPSIISSSGPDGVRSLSVAATQPSICNNLGHSVSGDSIMPVISTTMLPGNMHATNQEPPVKNKTQENASETKVILKPPKKRRSMDKKFENITINNGDIIHPTVSPLREIVDSSGKPLESGVHHKLEKPFGSDSITKHSVDNLLQHPPSSVVSTNNNNNNLIPGSCTHLPYESRSQHLPDVDSLTSSQTIPSSCSSSSLSQLNNSDDYHSRTASYHLNVSQPVSQIYSHSSFNSSSACQPSPQMAYPNHNGSSTASLPLPQLVSTTDSRRCPSTFHLPVQDEPMNLSKSCKPAIDTPQSETGVGENQAGTELPIVMPQHLQPQRLASEPLYPTTSLPRSQLKSIEGKKEKKNVCKVSRAEKTPTDSSDPHNTNGTVVNGLDSAFSVHGNVTGDSKQSDPLRNSNSCNNQTPNLSTQVPLELSGEPSLSLTVPSLCAETVSKESLNDKSPICPAVVNDASPSSSSISQPSTLSTQPVPTSSESLASPCSIETQTDIIQTATSEQGEAISKPSKDPACVGETTLKAKRPPKKRVEIPMDELSCANRINRYSLTIDDVITNFVYIPEPVEEFFLTEEEEAAIKDQFEDHQETNNLSNKDSTTKQSSIEAVTSVITATISSTVDTVVSDSSTEIKPKPYSTNTPKPPKKRACAGSQDSQRKVDNIDSVLAFVAADVFNSTAPAETSLAEVETKMERTKDTKTKDSDTTSPVAIVQKKKKKKSSKKEDLSVDNLKPKSEDGKEEEIKSRTEEENRDEKTGDQIKTGQPQTGEKKKVVKLKKPKIKKLGDGQTSKIVGQSDHPTDADKEGKSSEMPIKKKKKAEKKHVGSVENMSGQASASSDKDLLNPNRVETSDIGESIASTSGGSEQDTPVHETETKDEMVGPDHQLADKENQDTGLESGGDENKPVRRYKKRLDFVKCDQCEHQARGRSALSRHMKKVHMMDVNMPYKCQHCDYGCTKMASLNRHLFTHGVYPCSRCSFVTDERSKLTQHVADEHKDKLDMKLCKICNRYIKCDQTTIEQHSDACQGPTPFKCTECEKEFKYASSLRVHYHTHFPDQPKRFKCEQCDYRTNYKANLHKHHKNMHAAKGRDVQCPDCGKLFSTEDNMRRHRKVHSLVRPFACETCKKTFKTSGALKGHQLIHTATRPYTCNIPGCGRNFRTPKFLKSHQEEFHRLVPKKFFCPVEGCSYSFFKRSHLKRHAITHTGERNFHCTWPGCSKSFRHADNLKVHFRSHTNEKPVQCHLCDFKCKQKNSLFWHKKKVHQIIDASVCPKRLENSLKGESEKSTDKSENTGKETKEEGESVVPTVTESACQTIVDGIDDLGNEVLDTSATCPVFDKTKSIVEENSGFHVQVPVEQSTGTQTFNPEDQEPRDLYEFKSDDESEEEAPGNFRRDKIPVTDLTPLPPPPKELLRKNELQEKKEKEKKEREEKREMEKKEKLEKKELEKKEKAEKKEQERKERLEKKEQEKREKEQERREKAEKKEQERKEKEQEKKEKEQEKKEKAEKKEQEKKEKEKEKEEKKLAVKKSGKKKSLENSDATKDAAEQSKTKKSPNVMKRKKLVTKAVQEESKPEPEKSKRGRKKRPVEDTSQPNNKSGAEDGDKKKESEGPSPSKRKKMSPKKASAVEENGPVSKTVSRVGRKKSPAVTKAAVVKGKKTVKTTPPKRKPSARIKAKKKAKAKNVKVSPKGKKSPKAGIKKKPGRKKAEDKVAKEGEAEEEVEEVVEEPVEEPESQEEAQTVVPEEKPEEPKVPAKPDEEQSVLPHRPMSPSYSEEIMLQGKASPYQDFSDADDLEDDAAEEQEERIKKGDSPSHSAANSPDVEESAEREQEKIQSPPFEERHEEEVDEAVQPPADESSDDEVSNDIPLTPPRAPAPPPVESSEDEMEPEPEPAPFSVPGPSTPFSVPGPNTPFSVPPPTNLMQQHSVHSEEAPMSAIPSVPSMEMQHSQGSVEMQQPLGSVEVHPQGSVEMNHPHGSAEMHHPHGSVEMHHPHGSVEMHHPHGSVEMHHPHGSVELHHPHGSGEMHSHNTSGEMLPIGSVEMRSHGSVEMRSHGSVEMVQPHGSVEMQHSRSAIPDPRSHPDQHVQHSGTPENGMRGSSNPHKYDLPPGLQEQSQTTEAAKEDFDQYLEVFSAANNRATNGGLGPSQLQQLEEMVVKSHQEARELGSKSPISSLPTSVITSLENSLPVLPPGDLRSRIEAIVPERHHESLYSRDTQSVLPRLPERQISTPLPSNPPGPAFDAFSSLNPLHPAAAAGVRENSYLRQPENLYSTPPVTSGFMAEAMFQRQAMTTPFLPPQASDRSSLSRIPDTTPLRSTSSSTLLRRPGTMPGTEMFAPPSMAQAMPRNPFTNAWANQEVRPTHWQTPYLPRQPNMASAGTFFPTKDNYLTGREFMFDPSVRPSTERAMFPSLSTSQTQDSFQLDRFDLSNYFPNPMTPYASSAGSLDYTRSAHTAATKPFDERYRQTAAASAAIPEFRGLPPTTGSTDMFSGIPGVNSGFNLYASNPMAYHAQHMTDNVNSAFLTHSTSAQHAMFERDYAAAAAHRGLYPQNTTYPFIDERQYTGASKLGHTHPVAPTPAPQERDLMSRSAAPESQMQDPYRSMLYRY